MALFAAFRSRGWGAGGRNASNTSSLFRVLREKVPHPGEGLYGVSGGVSVRRGGGRGGGRGRGVYLVCEV